MKKKIYASNSRRAELIDLIEQIRIPANDDLSYDIEEILEEYGASEDDSDPVEGFYATMPDEDLDKAYEQIKAIAPQPPITFRFYFKDGNQKLIEAENIYEALSYICFDLGIQAINVRKIEEVR